ncbi:NAD(P)/FAD-dependent oxidoreductase [Maritimibacter dapengensis]|uniref:FAD-binding oxidoreductase n=1 Tax=Maritimibacter dapengensis TaxID=2836868 RepID=A0ABS6SY31_9RHOB|nr:FAD-binding oxidoreductase [Maritimibacter dapengensis]MBV7377862.1 FAD-binding oxidoreductase [Maritimibacter dapengensis]
MYDFLIIGGGIAGLTAGAHLASEARVCVVDGAAALGYHSSSRSAAVFVPSYGTDVVTALSRASEASFRDEGVLTTRGGMVVGISGEEAEFDEAVHGFGATEISAKVAADTVPLLDAESVSRTAIFDHVWDIDTDRLLQSYARRIRATGEIRLNAQVTKITHEDAGRWRVVAGGEELVAKVIVNAAGAWADDIATKAGIAPIGLTPKRRSMARVEVPGKLDPRGWPMIFGAAGDWYAKPDAGALIVSPADADPVAPQDAWADDMVLAEGIARFEERMCHPVTRMLANWAGLRTFTPDGDLAIGAEQGVSDFFWMAGQGGYGFQTAPAAGRLLALRALAGPIGTYGEVARACDPARFR